MGVAHKSAREAAVDLLLGVTEGRLPISDQIAAGALDQLEPPAKARAQRLALAALRHLSHADAILAKHLRKGPPPHVRAILRLATVEMLQDRAEPHGVVDAAVGMTRQRGRRSEGFAGLTNAVLRKVAVTAPEDWAALPPPVLPGWLRGRLMSAYGKAAVIAMEAAHLRAAPIDLTPKSGDAVALAVATGGIALPTGSVRLPPRVQVSDLPGFATGDWWVQDVAAALAAKALRTHAGEHVLDLCAAPGGKTLQLAVTGAEVTALDQSGPRMTRVAENLARCGLAAEMVVADALAWRPDRRYDAVLLDAPCSATGTIRRHPDLPLVRDPSQIKPLALLQAALIDRALAFVSPGGRIVFATCSLLPEEGEHQVVAALARHSGLAIDREAVALEGVDPAWIGPEGGLRLRPDYWADVGSMDGFYVAAFRAPG